MVFTIQVDSLRHSSLLYAFFVIPWLFSEKGVLKYFVNLIMLSTFTEKSHAPLELHCVCDRPCFDCLPAVSPRANPNPTCDPSQIHLLGFRNGKSRHRTDGGFV
jgi:hypothetical protein